MAVDVALADRIRGSLERERDVIFAYLFGSQGRGDAGPRSDVDIAVYMRPGADRDVLRLMTLVEGVGRHGHLDLIVLNDSAPAIAYAALEGLLLFSRDEGIRVEVEAAIAAEYLDREPRMARHLDEAIRAMAERGLG